MLDTEKKTIEYQNRYVNFLDLEDDFKNNMARKDFIILCQKSSSNLENLTSSIMAKL